jgi:hypothetical protein
MFAIRSQHCEFVKLQGSGSSSNAKSASDGASDAVKISLSLISVIVVAAALLGLFFVHRRRYEQRLSVAGSVKKNPRKASDTDLHLEADGETMKDVQAVLNGEEANSNNKPPTSPADTAISHDDDESVEAGVL